MPSENTQSKTSVQSIVRRPWDFACQWYGEAEVERSIQRHLGVSHDAGDRMPTDVSTPEFAKWLTDQYRHAMRKGAELATREIMDGIKGKFREPDTYIATCEQEGWNHARRSVERWLDGGD